MNASIDRVVIFPCGGGIVTIPGDKSPCTIEVYGRVYKNQSRAIAAKYIKAMRKAQKEAHRAHEIEVFGAEAFK